MVPFCKVKVAFHFLSTSATTAGVEIFEGILFLWIKALSVGVYIQL